jgi:amidase
MANIDLVNLSAVEMVKLIRAKDITAKELMEAHLLQIDRVNPKVNAIVTLLPDLAIEKAEETDLAISRGEDVGILQGLPVAHKDLVPTKGIRTTFGSPIYEDNVPDHNALIVDRIQQAGAITIGKTNTPEFGAGSQTYNEVFGETLNPYDVSKTCGGSSGGAAVALATRMLPIADGSDTGGSLRNPANFCNVIGFRPSPGRVPNFPSKTGWGPISVSGPMARNVSDCALFLSAIAGPDSRVPISITEPGSKFLQSLERDFSGTSIAWSEDLGGLPIDPRTSQVINSQRSVFSDLGCIIDDSEPDFRDANEVFLIWRGWGREITSGDLLRNNRAQLKETMIWDIEQGVNLTGPEVGWAESRRMELFQRMHEFMEKHEFLICPVSQRPPFDVKQRWVTEINGEKMENFIAWMKSCYYITATGHPAVSVPCGFTDEGLPVGIQIVGRYRDDFGVLQLAKAFEDATGFWKELPEVCG